MKETKIITLAVLFSGNGGNMQNLIESLHGQYFKRQGEEQGQSVKLHFALTLCNEPNAYGITRAEKLKIPCMILSHKDYVSREAYDEALGEILKKHHIEYVVLAGFMRILSATFTQNFKIFNIHPSFLPAHKGAHAIKSSFCSGEGCGVSVHWVNEELDGGEIIMQERIRKSGDENLEEFEKRVHELEYKLYPRAILAGLCLERDNGKYMHNLYGEDRL